MSLATIRTHVWKGGNDVVLYYKANGRKVITPLKQPSETPAAEGEGTTPTAGPPAPEAGTAAQSS